MEAADRTACSGLRVMDGEDQDMGNRVRMQQMQQQDWINQQQREKQLRQEQEQFQNK